MNTKPRNTPASIWLLLALALAFCAGASDLPGVGALEESLGWADVRIAETEQELKAAMARFDDAQVERLGDELRQLKNRRREIRRQIDEARAVSERHQVSETERRRPGIMRRLSELEPQVQAAAAAFEANPSTANAIRLRMLTTEQVELRNELRQSDSTRQGAPHDPQTEEIR